jgi:integrase
MARKIERLTAIKVNTIKEKGRYADGGGLYLQVGPTGGKAWLFRFTLNGRPREMGLGAVNAVSLKKAREKAAECRGRLADDIDPLAVRHSERAAKRLSDANTMTFDACATAYIKAHRSGWKNAKHAEQWTNTLKTYCNPVFGSLPVQEVSTAHVMRVLEPLWRTKTETAARIRGRIEQVLSWAQVHGYRSGENPARWRGHLDKLLAAPTKVKKSTHHAALPYAEIGSFWGDLKAQDGVAARALQFVVLTAVRTSEAIGAKWSEVDLDKEVWTIPAERMKARREHRVPLSDTAVQLLKALPRKGDFVFPGGKPKKPLSNMAMLTLLKRMGRDDLTVHGFRSTFRDWASEVSTFPSEVAEAALAHVVADKTEAAYRRGDLFEKRRKLMQSWAAYCSRASGGSVAHMRRIKSA